MKIQSFYKCLVDRAMRERHIIRLTCQHFYSSLLTYLVNLCLNVHYAEQLLSPTYILAQQSTTVSLAGLPVLRTLYKPMSMHKRTNSQNCEFCVL